MPIDDRTTNRSYQLPNVGNQLVEDVARLRAALQAIDADVFARYTKTEVDTLINDLIAGAPGALNTLDELAAALGDDANYAATVTTALANRYTKTESDSRYLSSTDGSVTTNNLAPGIAPIVTSLNGGPLAGMRNLLINANPIINQRSYVSGTATSGANQYTLDRWRVVTSGQSITWTDSANVRTVTAPAGGVEQVIEGLNILSGTYTLSWTGTATATVDGSAVTNGGQVTLTGGTNATVRFSGGTFSLAQLEAGTVATPFERRSYGQELALCQRYYEVGCLSSSSTSSGATSRWTLQYKQTKRASPTNIYTIVTGQNSTQPTALYADSSGAVGFSNGASVGDYTIWTWTSSIEL